jgi:hypothetical protein
MRDGHPRSPPEELKIVVLGYDPRLLALTLLACFLFSVYHPADDASAHET